MAAAEYMETALDISDSIWIYDPLQIPPDNWVKTMSKLEE